MRENTFHRIYDLVGRIPLGRVCTYGQIALMAGNPRLSRVVGYALHVAPPELELPCHRVVNRNGEMSPAFGPGQDNLQAAMLENEGIELVGGRVPLSRYMWYGEDIHE